MSADLLMMISPLDGRYRSLIERLALYFSEFGLLKYRVIVEINWLKHLSDISEIKEVPKLSKVAQQMLEEVIRDFSLKDASRIKEIENITNHDVKAVEYWLKEKFANQQEIKNIKEFFHFACTSEDINNISYALMLKNANEEVLIPILIQVIDKLMELAHLYAKVPMLSRTHGQPATPTTVGKELANFIYRLKQQLEKIVRQPFWAKANGAVGNYNAHYLAYPEVNWEWESKRFIESFGLVFNPYTVQIEPHDYMAEYFQLLLLINTILLDLNRDIWGYISLNYFKQKLKDNEVGSSTMPHKVNPIDFENSEGNLGLSNALLSHLSQKLPISRWQRDLTDSTVLRNIGVAIGYGLLGYSALLRGLNKLEINHIAIEKDLENHWELLAEPIQTIMRRYGLHSPYEQLKALTRGKDGITKEVIHDFIKSLELPMEVKNQLLQLTPNKYVGKAEELAERIC